MEGRNVVSRTSVIYFDNRSSFYERTFSRSTDVTSTDLVSAKGKTKEVYCCDIVLPCAY